MTLLLRNTLIALISLGLHSQEAGDRFAHLGKFRLEETTLGEIQNVLGPSTLIERGDAGDYEAIIRYRAQGVYVTFHSGEMGGRDNGLLGFSICQNLKDTPQT